MNTSDRFSIENLPNAAPQDAGLCTHKNDHCYVCGHGVRKVLREPLPVSVARVAVPRQICPEHQSLMVEGKCLNCEREKRPTGSKAAAAFDALFEVDEKPKATISERAVVHNAVVAAVDKANIEERSAADISAAAIFEPDDPRTIEAWRELHVDLLNEPDSEGGSARSDYPKFSEMDETAQKTGLGEDEKRAMGQVKILRDSGDLRRIPVWFHIDTAVLQFLKINFPNMLFDKDDQNIAAKWHFIIQRWRTSETAAAIAREWNNAPHLSDTVLLAPMMPFSAPRPSLSDADVRGVVQRIIYVASGLTQDGTTKGKRGRPKGKKQHTENGPKSLAA